MTPFEQEITTLLINGFTVMIDTDPSKKLFRADITKNRYTLGIVVDSHSSLDYVAEKLRDCRKVWNQDQERLQRGV